MERFHAPAGARNSNVIPSGHGYSTRSSARRAANKLIGTMMGLPLYGGRPSVRYRDCGCFGPAHDGDSMLDGDIIVRKDMISIYRAEDGWHWAVEWWLEDLVYGILDKPNPKYPDWCERKVITFRELINWTGPRDEYGWPCLDPRYIA